MLGKLIKHDFKSLSLVLFPTQLAVLGATILATIGFAFNLKADFSTAAASGGIGLLRIMTGFLSALMVLAIIASTVLVAFIIFQRFYKNLMCDEGYLTFTLPVTTSQILWSKLITATLWTIISCVVVFICVNIFVLFGTGQGFVNTAAYVTVGRVIHETFATIGARIIWPILEFLLFLLVATVNSILEVYLALIIGGIVAQKHKIFASIGFYFVINMAASIVMMLAQYCLSGTLLSSFNSINDLSVNGTTGLEAYNQIVIAAQPYFWFVLLLTAALTAVYFLLSHYLLKNKLNLE